MLFCSQTFLLFFTAVFVAYWGLGWRWGRLGLLLLTASYCLYIGWGSSALASASTDWQSTVTNVLAGLPGHDWMAGLILCAAAASCRLGPDRGRVWLLLGASFFFYASWNKWLAVIVCVSTLGDYLIARGLDASTSERLRKLLLATSVIANLGILCYFKYANFFLRSLEDGLRAGGASASLPVLSVILPLGISFYTFEAINYVVDVYRRRLPARKNLADFMLFILFFPHLVAGPIVRAADFLPQVGRRKRWSWPRQHLGVQLILVGLVKKLVIADRMAWYADPVFADPAAYGSGAVWLATLAYALQIYCDFSGYTDMALGTAHMLGYKLAMNFNLPYLSANVSEFWRRWHISLSSWLRDYLFIPLGGSRSAGNSIWQRYTTERNLMVTMTLGGLWHGAAWPFVIWGALHGLLLILHRHFRAFAQARPRLDGLLQSAPGTAMRIAATFLCVSICWVFFRATTLSAAWTMLERLATPTSGKEAPLQPQSFWWIAIAVALCYVLTHRGVWNKLSVRLPAPVLGFGYAAMLTLSLLLSPELERAFIYFQF
jgi:alginate O-acetyltransferase complex protein AlgI